MTTLVVAAHPEDEVLGCGGTICRLADSGKQVYVGILGQSTDSRYTKRDEADHLGAVDLQMSGLPYNRFDSIDLLDIVKIVEGLVEKWSPDVVYTHHGGDLNIDHAIAHRAVLTATRPWAAPELKAVYAFEAVSATEWSFNQTARPFSPNVFVDIEKTLQRKIEALAMCGDEVRPFPHPGSAEAIEAAAAHWGTVPGVRRAEPFELVREIR